MFVLNSFEDSWQDGCILTAMPVTAGHPGSADNCSSAPGYAGVCTTPNPACSPAQISNAYIPFGARMRTLFSSSPKAAAPGGGGFLHSCVMHCEGQTSAAFVGITVGGVSMKDEVTKWLASGFTAPASWTVDVPLSPTAPYASNPSALGGGGGCGWLAALSCPLTHPSPPPSVRGQGSPRLTPQLHSAFLRRCLRQATATLEKRNTGRTHFELERSQLVTRARTCRLKKMKTI